MEQGGKTIDEAFRASAARWPETAFLIAPAEGGGAPHETSYGEAAEIVSRWAGLLSAAGYGHGHRVAMLVGNRPEFLLLKLALARIGASMVPVNPDYRPAELAYLLEDSGANLAISETSQQGLMEAGVAEARVKPAIALLEEIGAGLPPAPRPAPEAGGPKPESEASLLYTSGTTGRPKGCILSHETELMYGESYLMMPDPIRLRHGDRVLNPLPLFHANAGVICFHGLMQAGAAHVIPPRFSMTTWWRDIRDTEATLFHYLGVVMSVIMAEKDAGRGDVGRLRAALGAGIEPALHGPFEERFGIPAVECWGMTEMCRAIFIAEEPRLIHTRAIGRGRPGLECRIVDREDREVPRGASGELVIRHSEATPRRGFFSGYLNKPEATEEAWRGGWFHTGDTMSMDESGMIYFIDRSKNIIRRSGENIAAAEVENCLFEDARVSAVACIAAPDEVREEEVMACIVLKPGAAPDEATARSLFDHAFRRISFFKAPGWIRFMDALPVTGTQKVVKHRIFAEGEDPRTGAFDFRGLKKRG